LIKFWGKREADEHLLYPAQLAEIDKSVWREARLMLPIQMDGALRRNNEETKADRNTVGDDIYDLHISRAQAIRSEGGGRARAL
jgi:hypothetical protein